MDLRPAVRDLGKTTGKYVQSMGWRSVNNHLNISLVNKYVYFEVPKAGCGTMKSTLGGLEAARFNESLVELVQENPHQRKNATPFVKPYQLHSPAENSHALLSCANQHRAYFLVGWKR